MVQNNGIDTDNPAELHQLGYGIFRCVLSVFQHWYGKHLTAEPWLDFRTN